MRALKTAFTGCMATAIVAATFVCTPTASAASSADSGNPKLWYSFQTGSNVLTGLGQSMTVDQLKKNVNTACSITVQNSSRKTLSGSDVIGTGSYITFGGSNGVTVDEVRAVVYGDVDGDGKVTSSDTDNMTNAALKVDDFARVQKTACVLSDENKQSEDVEVHTASAALLAAKQQAAGVQAIDQNFGDEKLSVKSRSTINSIEEIIQDQQLVGEGIPKGVPSGYAWYAKPLMNTGYKYKSEFPYATLWGQVYDEKEGNPATNSRVQVRNLRTYYLSKSTGNWVKIHDSTSTGIGGTYYTQDFKLKDGSYTKEYTAKDETSNGGGVSATLEEGYCFHFWHGGGQRAKINIDDCAGLYVTAEARLIVDDPSKADDRDQARYIMSIGLDNWCEDDMISVYKANGETPNPCPMMGRFKYVRNYWRSFNSWCYTDNSGDVFDKSVPEIY